MSRSKEQWLSRTGGFRVGEDRESFQRRTWNIEKLRKAVRDGTATEKDIERLAALLGVDDADE